MGAIRRIPPVAAVVAAIVIQFVMVTAYAWSSASAAPRNVPVAVTGPQVAVTVLTSQAARAYPGAFRFIDVASPDLARQAISGRIAYGAIILEGHSSEVLTASAASPAIASVLTGMAAQLSGSPTSPPNVADIVPVDHADPDGAAFGFTLLPVVITSVIAGVLLSIAVGSALPRAGSLVAFGVGGGTVTAAVAHTWLGILPGAYLALAAVLGLIALGISAAVAGLGALAGRAQRTAAGLGLGVALIMLLGNPFSGVASAPEMLPGAWGTIGQQLPPGAGATLLRAVAYFNGARSAGPWAVLATWAAVGLLLVTLSAVTRQPRGAGKHQVSMAAAR